MRILRGTIFNQYNAFSLGRDRYRYRYRCSVTWPSTLCEIKPMFDSQSRHVASLDQDRFEIRFVITRRSFSFVSHQVFEKKQKPHSNELNN